MNAAMKRARTSGELARRAGRPLSANPYRKSSSTRTPRRGSWSEAFARQWALGWKEVDERSEGGEQPDLAAATSSTRARQGIAAST